MFYVLNNGKPAHVRETFLAFIHSDFKEAVLYAKLYLGSFDCIPDNWNGKKLDYTGYKDFIEIMELK
jgi:hypothetical protein